MSYKNKEDQAKAARRHYEANKDKIKNRARLFTDVAINRNREYVKSFLEKILVLIVVNLILLF